jgi:anti-anti-sigma regulatory factor
LTAGATLVLSGVSEVLKRMLDQASLSSMLKVYGTDAEAVRALSVEHTAVLHH